MASQVITKTGYVISSAKYQEKDAIITLLTEEGKFTAKVNGGYQVVSKNHFATMIFNKVCLDLNKNGDFYSCSGSKLITEYASLYQEIEQSIIGQLLCEVSLKGLQDGDEVPYQYLEACFKALKENFDSRTVAFIYLCQICKSCGIAPYIDGCVNCQNKKNLVAFSFIEGGFICARCAQEIGLLPSGIDYMKVIRYGFMVTPEQVTHAKLPVLPCRIAINDISQYMSDELGITLNSIKLLNELTN